MKTNADMTVFHLSTDLSTKESRWVKTIIRRVAWFGNCGVTASGNVNETGTDGADRVSVYIPRSSWNGDSPPCLPEDRIERGISTADRPGTDALAVVSVKNCDMGRFVQHWAIKGV